MEINKKTKRDDVIPYYVELIENETNPRSEKVYNINKQIIKRWSSSALTYIKNEAWKVYDQKQKDLRYYKELK